MSLTERETHFEFGENWRNYSKTIDQKRIDSAIEGVRKLFPDGLAGKTSLDIGCGSGLHSLAALSLGAVSATAIDIDENSVGTTQELLTQHAFDLRWTAKIASIFDAARISLASLTSSISGVSCITPATCGKLSNVQLNSSLLVASLRLRFIPQRHATPCGKLRRNSIHMRNARFNGASGKIYIAAHLAAQTLMGRNPISYVRNYSELRGMNFSHDAHDWLGGYPYETATAAELDNRICKMGFTEVRSFPLPVRVGLLGSGCHEFVFRKAQ